MNELVFEKNDRPVTTSLKVAEYFGKLHKNVIRDIEEKILADADANFNRLNFERIFYKDSMNRKQSAYAITKDGFALLAMGFTGKKAASEPGI